MLVGGALAGLAAFALLRDHRAALRQATVPSAAGLGGAGVMLAPLFLEALATGRDVWPEPNEVPGSYLSGVFASAGQDAWLAVEL